MSHLEKLKKISSSSLADADKTIRCLNHQIIRYNGNEIMVGKARVVKVHNDFLGVLTTLADAKSGEVLVVNASATYDAVLGGLFCTEAQRKGLSGLVVDGLIRDVDYIKTLQIPVYARGCRSSAGSTNAIPIEQTEIFCGGVRVSTGDILVGDGDGVVVIDPNDLNETVQIAAEIERKESIILKKLRAGVTLSSMLNLEQHLEKLRQESESYLGFVIDE